MAEGSISEDPADNPNAEDVAAGAEAENVEGDGADIEGVEGDGSDAEGAEDGAAEGEMIGADQSEESMPSEPETIETTGAPGPVVDNGHGLLGCNPFSCGCWIYLLLALIIGVVLGFLLGAQHGKKKEKKKRKMPVVQGFTKLDENPPSMEELTGGIIADSTAAGAGVTAAVHYDVGARKDQQDSYGVSDLNAYGTNGVLAVVADGMGGLANGKIVSGNLVTCLLNYFRQTTGRERVPDMMLDMLAQSNDQINRLLQGADRSGSTLVSAIIRGGYLHFLTVGDSRIYLYRHGILLQLNREHIYQEELALKAVNHIVPLAQVTGDRQAHALTSYLGIGRLTHLDRNYEGIKLEPGDRILLASDGVFGTLSQEDMEAALRSSIGEATEIIGEMIRKANMQYQDNNTALVLEYHG